MLELAPGTLINFNFLSHLEGGRLIWKGALILILTFQPSFDIVFTLSEHKL